MSNMPTKTVALNKIMNNPDFLHGFKSMKQGDAFDADYQPQVSRFGYERGRQFAMFYDHYTFRQGRGVSRKALLAMVELVNSKSII